MIKYKATKEKLNKIRMHHNSLPNGRLKSFVLTFLFFNKAACPI
jgi:hypothetical protein